MLVGSLFISCNHRIVRTGYKADISDYKYCDIAIKINQAPDTAKATKLGEIKLGEAGFSTDCNEEKALTILKGEGCALDADLIVIFDEVRPNIWSSCYRCRAEFYKFADTTMKLKSDPIYSNEQLRERIKKDRSTNVTIVAGLVAATIIIGFLIF